MKIAIVGEILWDLVGGGEHLGGAPLNFTFHLSRLQHSAMLFSAVGRDARGARALEEIAAAGVPVSDIQIVDAVETGIAGVLLGEDRQPRFEIRRPAAYDHLRLLPDIAERVRCWRPDWVYFGTLHQSTASGREATRSLLEACPDAHRFYDVNLRPGCWTPALVEELLQTADVVKLNDDERLVLQRHFTTGDATREQFCRRFADKYGWRGVCLTMGADGCGLLLDGNYAEVPACRVEVVDAVGAGDAFAAGFLHGVSLGWPLEEIGRFSNRLAALVASRVGGTPMWTLQELETVTR